MAARKRNGDATLSDVVDVLGNVLKTLTQHGEELRAQREELRGQREELRGQREEQHAQRQILVQVVQRLDGLTVRFDNFAQDVVRSRTTDSERFLAQERRIQRLEERVFEK
jgi:hypothetical protein